MVHLVGQAELLVLYRDAPLHNLIDAAAQVYFVVLVVDFFQDLGALVDAYDRGRAFDYFVLDKGVAVDEAVGVVLVEEGVFVELGCEEAAELGG